MTPSAFHLVVVEDDAITRGKLAGYLANDGYRVSEAESAESMRALVQRDPAHLFLIDIQLPGEDGLKLTRDLRSQSEVGIILVTGRSDMVDRIVGLEMGADDYITKPFNHRELQARVKNLLRRVQHESFGGGLERQFEGWRYDLARRRLTDPEGAPVELTHAEHQLLSLFLRNAGQLLTREQILRQVAQRGWDAYDRTADVLVQRLRRKLGDMPRQARFIQTAHGEGYLFIAPLG